MLQVVKTMYDYIHNLKKKVLVHCHAGYGRTGTTIACYKILPFKESFKVINWIYWSVNGTVLLLILIYILYIQV